MTLTTDPFTEATMESGPKEEVSRTKKLIEAGSEFVGTAVGGIIGFIAGGPGGAVIGAGAGTAINHTLRHVGAEFQQRVLSPREEMRVGAVLGFAIARIQENLKDGVSLRGDGFFDPEIDDRSAADEICEAVLLAGQREVQEKKLRFLGNLMGNLPFHPEIDRVTANQLISLAERLSYRQLCLIEVCASKDLPTGDDQQDVFRSFGQWESDWSQAESGMPSVYYSSVIQDTYELYTQGLIRFCYSRESLSLVSDIDPNLLYPSNLAYKLRNLMQLGEIKRDDIEQTVQLLSGPPADFSNQRKKRAKLVYRSWWF